MADYFARPIYTLEDAQAYIHLVNLMMEDPVARRCFTGDEVHSILAKRDYLLNRAALYHAKKQFTLEEMQKILNPTKSFSDEEEARYQEWKREGDLFAERERLKLDDQPHSD